MHKFQIVGGDFGRGDGSYEGGSVYLANDSWRSILTATRVETNATFLQRDWVQAGWNGLKAGGLLAPIAMFAAPAVAIAVPFGLTIAAVGAGLAFWNSGTTDAVLMEVTFDDGKHFVAVCETYIPGLLSNDMAVARKVGWNGPAPVVIDGTSTTLSLPSARSSLSAVQETVTETAGTAVSATGAALSSAGEAVADYAASAASSAGSAFSSALKLVKRGARD